MAVNATLANQLQWPPSSIPVSHPFVQIYISEKEREFARYPSHHAAPDIERASPLTRVGVYIRLCIYTPLPPLALFVSLSLVFKRFRSVIGRELISLVTFSISFCSFHFFYLKLYFIFTFFYFFLCLLQPLDISEVFHLNSTGYRLLHPLTIIVTFDVGQSRRGRNDSDLDHHSYQH